MAKIIALVAVLCLTAVIAERQIFHYRSSAPPSSAWELTGEPDRDALISFTIALKQRNLDILESLFWRNSDPTSPQFAQHLTHDEVLNIVAPARDVHTKIMQWIKKASESTLATGGHIEELENLGDAIAIRANVHFIEELFETKLYKFEAEGRTVVKHLGALSVPAELVQYIDLITGITEFAPTNIQLKKTSKRAPADDDNQCNVPYNLKNLYNVPQTLTVTNPNANISIFAVGSIGSPEGFGFSSVTYWEKINGLPNNPITCIIGDGASNITPNDTDGEAQLDTQMVTGMAVNAKTCFWIIDGWMYDFTQNIFHTPTSPLVVSMSYAWLEWEQCDNITDGVTFVGNCTALHIPNSAGYVNRTNVEFQKLGLVGHTLVAAAGDDGTCGNHGSPNDCTKMAPLFPAASPYVLSVGATSIEASSVSKKNALGGSPPVCTNATYNCVCSTSQNEQVASQSNTAEFDTGGGFSLYTPRPSYQDNAVTGYLKSGVSLPSSQYGWNQNGRGYPDIGAVGENFCVVDKGSSCSLVAGTSASAPLISSLITLLNNDRLNAGKTPLGFINPTIYAMYDADSQKYFNNQFDTQTNGGECGPNFGFTQKAGLWSPLVGVGSPKFDQIRTYVNNLP